ncbi:hypothetical protein GCM10027056_17740 [Glaciibacter psychrotolerans]
MIHAVKNVKNWSFNTCAITGFSLSSFAVMLLIVNALAQNLFVGVLLPIAVVALVLGGAVSVRAHFLWIQGNKDPKKPVRRGRPLS